MAYIEDLRQVARFRGLTVKQVAERLEISEEELLTRYAEGLTPPPELDSAISRVLDIPEGSLLEGRVSAIPLCTGRSSSRKKLFLRSFFSTLSIVSIALPVTFIVVFLLLMVSNLLTEFSDDSLTIIYGAVAGGFLLYLIIYFLYRFGPSRLYGKDGPVSVTVTFGGLRISGLKGVDYGYRYDDLGTAGVLECRTSFVMTPEGKPFICLPKEGLSEQEISAVRRLFSSSIGSYKCVIDPTPRNGFIREEDVIFATKSHKTRIGWAEITLSACLAVIACVLGFALLGQIYEDYLLVCGGAVLLGFGAIYLAVARSLLLPRKVEVLSWIATGIAGTMVLAGAILVIVGCLI